MMPTDLSSILISADEDAGEKHEPEHGQDDYLHVDVDLDIPHEDDGVGDQGEQLPPQVEESQIRRSTRVSIPSTRYPCSEYVIVAYEGEPESFQEVQSLEDKDQWVAAMQEEMDSLKKE